MAYDENGHFYNDPNSTQSVDDQNYVNSSADTPIWGWLSGTSAQRDREVQAAAGAGNRRRWEALHPPTAQDLQGSPEMRAAQQQALTQLQQWGTGGLTGADRSGMEMQRGRDQQASGAAQRSLMQQAQGRGVGGSGLDFALQQGAQQQGQQQSSDAESQMLQHAQQRGLAAIALEGQMQQHQQSATQGAWQAQADQVAGETGQYGTDTQARQYAGQRQDQNNQSLAALFGSLF